MTFKSIGDAAFVAGAFLLVSRLAHRVHQWSFGKRPARSELDEKLRTEGHDERLHSSHLGPVLGTATVTCYYGAHLCLSTHP